MISNWNKGQKLMLYLKFRYFLCLPNSNYIAIMPQRSKWIKYWFSTYCNKKQRVLLSCIWYTKHIFDTYQSWDKYVGVTKVTNLFLVGNGAWREIKNHPEINFACYSNHNLALHNDNFFKTASVYDIWTDWIAKGTCC